MSIWDNPEETPEEGEQEMEQEPAPEEYPEVVINVETQWQSTRRRLFALFMALDIISIFASYWLAVTIGGSQFWAGTAVFTLLALLLTITTYQGQRE